MVFPAHSLCDPAPDVRSGGPGRQGPDRLSFMRSLRVIRRQVIDKAALSPLPAE